MLVSIHSQR